MNNLAENLQYADSEPEIDLSIYDKFIVFFSGGKDSQASVLHLLECGVECDRIELHHHVIDGLEGSELMDWSITESYCYEFANAMGISIYWSYREGGFEREMLREDQLTGAIHYQDENGQYHKTGGIRGTLNTRLKFPQVSADLRVRWCSAYLKVDVGARLLTSQERFKTGQYLVITGERAEESSARAKYQVFEPHRTDRRDGKRVQRYIDHWRPVHNWDEYAIWSILQKWGVVPHPAYYVGFGRCSCMCCIFGSANQWATIKSLAPEKFETIANYEEQFGVTMHRKLSVRQQAEKGTSYDVESEYRQLALSSEYNQPILVDPNDWIMPAGAFGDSSGPT